MADAEAPIFIINGFYMSMREKYTKAGAKIHYFVVEWDSASLSWADFRGQALGATDPATAGPASLRGSILERWEALGLAAKPNIGDNGVHGSASPFEALVERNNWLGVEIGADAFGAALLKAGLTLEQIQAYSKDPQVTFEGKKASLFDSLEDVNSDVCIQRLQEIAGVKDEGKEEKFTSNSAFMFIKPHAVTPAAVALVTEQLAALGLKVTAQGELDNETIESKKLIDSHYYAIACKASLTKPVDLAPAQKAQDDFKAKWGLEWSQAVADGLVFNAVDGCAKLGLDGAQMDAVWAKAKSADQLVKFGGGFYCGKL